jgi:hypothetical protein
MGSFRNQYATFEAREAERITGVSGQTQREWRRRGFFERAGEGRADHDVHDLARLIVMRALADRAVGPADSSKIAASAALRIQYFAMSVPGAIEDKTGGEFTRGMKSRHRPLASAFVHWTDRSGDPTRYVVADEDGSMIFTNDLAEAFDGRLLKSAVFVLDLKALGITIAERAARPLAFVEIKQKAMAQ